VSDRRPQIPIAGRFITLEGGEGAGKSTQCAALADALGTRGIAVVRTREPGGAPGAEEIRKLLVGGAVDRWEIKTEALLHYAARAEHLARTILPALVEGRWVISDRFADSTIAYQGYGLGLNRDWINALHRLVVGSLRPDITFVLDLPIELGLARAGRRAETGRGDENRYERMDEAFHERLRAGLLAIAAAEPQRCVVIDASQPIPSVQAAIWQALSTRLPVEPA